MLFYRVEINIFVVYRSGDRSRSDEVMRLRRAGDKLLVLENRNSNEILSFTLTTIDGRSVAYFDGTVAEFNSRSNLILGKANSLGTYVLNVKRANGSIEHFKVIKM